MIPKRHLSKFDQLARKLTLIPRQHYLSYGTTKDMPRLLWKDGITSLTNLTASDKVGIFLTVVVLALTDQGKDLLCYTVWMDNPQNYTNMVQCFQMILCYWMWLKKDSYWNLSDTAPKRNAKEAIRVMLKDIKRLWPRAKGQKWDLPKFHEQLHVPDDIEMNGCPAGSHSGPAEHNHIANVKKPAKTAQQRYEDLDNQLPRDSQSLQS